MECITTERRRRPRISTMILCEVEIGSNPPELVRVRDLSECGLKIATTLPLRLGEAVRVRLPGASEWTMARVVWRNKGVAGLSFVRSINLPQVSGASAPAQTATERFELRRRLAG